MKKITITLTSSNLKNIEELATKLFTSKSAAVRLLISNYFKNNLKINNKKTKKENETKGTHTSKFITAPFFSLMYLCLFPKPLTFEVLMNIFSKTHQLILYHRQN
jgi:hypothetical protein